MDYTSLADKLLRNMHKLRKVNFNKKMNESMRGEMFMLKYIAHAQDAVLPSDISNEMDISSARIAAALNNMENKGLITREIDKSDRRRILIRLTDKGKSLAEEHRQAVIKDVEGMLSLLGERDATEFVRIIGKLAELNPKCKETK